MSFPSDRPRSRVAVLLVAILLAIIVALAAGAFVLRPRLESDPPQITLSNASDMLGLAPLEIAVSDKGSGLRSVAATLIQGGSEHPLASEQFAQPVAEKKYTVSLAKVAGVKEGPATLRVTARDASLWHLGKGNEAVLEKAITIDITPPTLELVADDRYINFGGVGVIVYRASADTASSGIKMGDYWFPGFPGQVKEHPDYFLALFAHPYSSPPSARPTLVATDKAGNVREMRLAYELKNVKYKKSTIAVSDAFFQNKVVPLLTDVSKRQGSVKDVFVAVDKGVRKENEDRITEVTTKATPQMLWKDAFAQLSNSKVEANFADERTYTYNGQPIDTALHLGYDLSVTKNYPVEASNSGKVAFTGDLGLYGNAVILDHGLGLFTLYGHMSAIDVKVGDSIARGQPLGKTGETGFAGGDHLHFGVYLDGLAILPVEWWDQKWIDENITPKLAGHSGQEIAETQQAVRIAKKKARRGR